MMICVLQLYLVHFCFANQFELNPLKTKILSNLQRPGVKKEVTTAGLCKNNTNAKVTPTQTQDHAKVTPTQTQDHAKVTPRQTQ